MKTVLLLLAAGAMLVATETTAGARDYRYYRGPNVTIVHGRYYRPRPYYRNHHRYYYTGRRYYVRHGVRVYTTPRRVIVVH